MDTTRFEASQSDEGRYRMLVEAVTTTPSICSTPRELSQAGIRVRDDLRATSPPKSSASIFRTSIPRKTRRPVLPQRALEIAAREGKFENEGWRVRKDGTRFWAYVIIDPIRDDNGKLVGFAKVTRDLTERRQAEAELRKSQEQFRLLVQGVTDYAIYLLSPEGNITSWNAGAQRIKGYAPEEVIGSHFSRFYTEEDREAGLPAIALETAAREGRFREGRPARPQGRLRNSGPMSSSTRYAMKTGHCLGLPKSRATSLSGRTRSWRWRRPVRPFIQAQKMEAIGQLTGGIAHDFNNLLMAIQGSLELMKRRLPENDEVFTKFLDNALQGAHRGAALTQRMLAFARRQELKLEPLDLPELVFGMTNLLQSSLGPSVQIDTHFPLRLPKALADPNQLELALLNLAVNARDAMPKGGSIAIAAKEVTVTADPVLKPGRLCLRLRH